MSVQIINTPLYIDHNPYGNGLVLIVPRGIPCENHAKVYSCHSSNTPSLEDVNEYLKVNHEFYSKVYNKFVDMMETFGYGPTNANNVCENIANTFFNWMIKDITEHASR